MLTILCADKKCKQKNSCLRYVTDPSAMMAKNRRVRVEASLRMTGFEECRKYVQINETKDPLKYETHL